MVGVHHDWAPNPNRPLSTAALRIHTVAKIFQGNLGVEQLGGELEARNSIGRRGVNTKGHLSVLVIKLGCNCHDASHIFRLPMAGLLRGW